MSCGGCFSTCVQTLAYYLAFLAIITQVSNSVLLKLNASLPQSYTAFFGRCHPFYQCGRNFRTLFLTNSRDWYTKEHCNLLALLFFKEKRHLLRPAEHVFRQVLEAAVLVFFSFFYLGHLLISFFPELSPIRKEFSLLKSGSFRRVCRSAGWLAEQDARTMVHRALDCFVPLCTG